LYITDIYSVRRRPAFFQAIEKFIFHSEDKTHNLMNKNSRFRMVDKIVYAIIFLIALILFYLYALSDEISCKKCNDYAQYFYLLVSFLLGFLACLFILGKSTKRTEDIQKETINSDKKNIEAANIAENLHVLAENLPEFVSIKNNDLKFIFVNKCFINWVKLERHEVVGKTVYDIYPPDQAEEFDYWDRKSLRERTVISRDIDLLYPDGQVRTVISTRIPLISSSGKLLGLGTLNFDISARKRIEKDLEAAKEKAESANRLKSKFLANVSHELRTPLNAILGFSEIMENQLLGPIGNDNYLTYARDIRQSGLLLMDLINDLLDLSKIESGDFPLEETDVSLVHILLTAARMLQESCNRKSITMSLSIMREKHILSDGREWDSDGIASDIFVYADQRLILQALLNIMSNAVKFTPEGGEISIDLTVAENGQLELSISDTGSGVPEDKIPELFEPFTQLEDAYLRASQGAGLGLALVRSFIELHGGRVEMSSTLNVGTVLHLTLPPERVLEINHPG